MPQNPRLRACVCLEASSIRGQVPNAPRVKAREESENPKSRNLGLGQSPRGPKPQLRMGPGDPWPPEANFDGYAAMHWQPLAACCLRQSISVCHRETGSQGPHWQGLGRRGGSPGEAQRRVLGDACGSKMNRWARLGEGGKGLLAQDVVLWISPVAAEAKRDPHTMAHAGLQSLQSLSESVLFHCATSTSLSLSCSLLLFPGLVPPCALQ